MPRRRGRSAIQETSDCDRGRIQRGDLLPRFLTQRFGVDLAEDEENSVIA
jgi:hypothetical protein